MSAAAPLLTSSRRVHGSIRSIALHNGSALHRAPTVTRVATVIFQMPSGACSLVARREAIRKPRSRFASLLPHTDTVNGCSVRHALLESRNTGNQLNPHGVVLAGAMVQGVKRWTLRPTDRTVGSAGPMKTTGRRSPAALVRGVVAMHWAR